MRDNERCRDCGGPFTLNLFYLWGTHPNISDVTPCCLRCNCVYVYHIDCYSPKVKNCVVGPVEADYWRAKLRLTRGLNNETVNNT